ncbi:Mu transposase domain-containing protein [Methylobacterium hispanicum]|uniref:Mu transposase domain-containing protein n=1 Tax=Methylobacterium hispanicum TaxID=270350 RepID=UPI003AF6985C
MQRDHTVQTVFEAEDRPSLIPYRGAFDGFHGGAVVASKACLVRYDYNRHSVAARVAGRHVQLRAYADRITVFLNGEIVAEHRRCFGRYQTIFNAWHRLPVLARKPGALRNGEPFRDWDLPCGLAWLSAVPACGRTDAVPSGQPALRADLSDRDDEPAV